MRSTTVKPPNGKPASAKSRSAQRSKFPGIGLRRLTKRQKDKIYRIVVTVFLIVFTVSIVGGIIALTVLAPAK